MFKKYYLLVLMGLFLMVGCQKETIMPVNGGLPGSTLRDGDGDCGSTDEDGGITDPNNEDEEEDNDTDQITDPNNEDEEEDNDTDVEEADDQITDPNNEDEEEDDNK